MNQRRCKLFQKENPLVLDAWEFLYGILMAVAAFHMLPLSFEIAGLFLALVGTAMGILMLLVFQRFFFRYRYVKMSLCLAVLIAYVLFRLPFGSYVGNGLYLGALAGMLLAFQIQMLSLEKNQNSRQKIRELWYIGGLLLGILLK